MIAKTYIIANKVFRDLASFGQEKKFLCTVIGVYLHKVT